MSTVVTNPVSGAKTTYQATHDIFTVGAGQVDGWAAYNDMNVPSGSAASPQATYNSRTGVLTVANIAGLNTIRGSNAIWGSSSAAINGFNAIRGSQSIREDCNPGADVLTIAINGET